MINKKNLKHGVYKINWKKKFGGGHSLASIGTDSEGNLWIAPCNWISGSTTDKKVFKWIKSIVLIQENDY